MKRTVHAPARRGAVGFVGVVGAALAMVLSACTIGNDVDHGAGRADDELLPQPSIGAPAPPAAKENPAPQGSGVAPDQAGYADDVQGALSSAVATVTSTFGGQAAVAISGQSGEFAAGGAAGFASWSTIKVPIAIAALKEHPEMAAQATAAIQVSDNDAAAALWDSVTPESVEAVLAEGHSPVTVQRMKIRPEFSPFGQTQWSVPEQARFASHLQCVNGSQPVLDLMAGIAADQSYGLGTVPGARFKGGWGPSASTGAYEVRQFGLVLDQNGREVAVALAVSAADGSYESGQSMASQLAALLVPALNVAPPAAC